MRAGSRYNPGMLKYAAYAALFASIYVTIGMVAGTIPWPYSRAWGGFDLAFITPILFCVIAGLIVGLALRALSWNRRRHRSR